MGAILGPLPCPQHDRRAGQGDIVAGQREKRGDHGRGLRVALATKASDDAIESDPEVVQKQLARLPTRQELAGTALGIVLRGFEAYLR
jgi:hypothetical protein